MVKGRGQGPANGQQLTLPIRGNNATTLPVGLQLHHIAPKEALLVKMQPPQAPSKYVHHVPCDIVLAIDISASMGEAAPVPGEDASEDTGLSVLDLAKHAAFTVIETMDERDHLGIVTFGTQSGVVQLLEPMNEKGKEKARERIKALRPMGSTTLWLGLVYSINLFYGDEKRVRAVMVLTDGMPNRINPLKGFISKLRLMDLFPVPIHTFGFGYRLKSGLLKSLAEFSGGNYAFIPDAGMIGTVFIHAVANLQSTFAIRATLKLKYTAPIEIEETLGDSVDKQAPTDTGNGQMQLTIPLGNIQYGQSRDIWLRIKNTPQMESLSPIVDATLTFEEPGVLIPSVVRATPSRSVLHMPALSPAEIAYHESRARICNFLSSLFPLGPNGERGKIASKRIYQKGKELTQLIDNLPGRNFNDERNKSLMEDLDGEHPQGQISLAIKTPDFFEKWGRHFLLSYLNAHTRQICNSFKDAGPLQYGANSPLFIACRTRLDDVFDNLPAPEPSRTIYTAPISYPLCHRGPGATD